MQNKKLTKILGIALAVVLVAVGIVFIVKGNSDRKSTSNAKNITFTVITENEKKEFKISTERDFLGAALTDEKLLEGTESEYGLFVTAVNGITADDSNQEWWCFTKGGESLETGVDTTPITDGDSFEATLTLGW